MDQNVLLKKMTESATDSRRDFIKKIAFASTSALIISNLLPELASAGTLFRSDFERRLKIRNPHTGESLDIIYAKGRDYYPESLLQIDRLMRDHRRNIHVPIDLKLIEGLHKLSLLLGRHLPIDIICGFRTYFTNEMLRQTNHRVAEESYHMKGRAVDIRVQGVSPLHVQRASKLLKMGGVGYYPKAKFVHLDTGPIRFW